MEIDNFGYRRQQGSAGNPERARAAQWGCKPLRQLNGLGVNAFEALRTGESTAIAAIEGKASTQQAVMATMEAEKSLQAALAIRDKIVSAFLEISRMQI